MNLAIAILAARVVLTFTTPGSGTYYVLRHDTPWSACVVASGFETNACTVAIEVPAGGEAGIYVMRFYPGVTNPD